MTQYSFYYKNPLGCFPLYLVTNRHQESVRLLKSKIVEAVKGGVNIVQLREKDITDSEYITIAKEVKPLLDQLNIPLIINDNPYIAKEVNAHGVHLGQSDCNSLNARKILGKKAIIGLSIETLDQTHNVNNLPIDYAVISPIFYTNTKADTSPPFGITNARKFRGHIQKPLLAIGGINEANITNVLETGIDGICVSSAIFNSPSPKFAAQSLKNKITDYLNNNYA